ncbi:hypothetical protein C8F01DRAFT_1088742 [Mycena amicta]|nr:hypothetical protein C8F01DRAFT_1088742 [Mycena amicta]
MQLVTTLLLLLASALPALSLSSNVTFFFGADCSGPIVAESTGSSPGECLYLADGGSAKSISYSVPIPSQLQFFASGGPNDICAGVPASTTVLETASTGEGCANAPDGYNLEKGIGNIAEFQHSAKINPRTHESRYPITRTENCSTASSSSMVICGGFGFGGQSNIDICRGWSNARTRGTATHF